MMREKLLTNAVKQPEPELLFLIVIPFPSVTKACEYRGFRPERSAGSGHAIEEIDNGIACSAIFPQCKVMMSFTAPLHLSIKASTGFAG